jgi:large subunit ribosomal protein L22
METSVTGHDVVASATLRHLGTSAQKTRLVVDLVRGQRVDEAVATLRLTKKAVARDLSRLLDSAVANARQKHQDVDVDRLFIATAFVDGGPSQKRIRPAPMGRAFRIQKRSCHVTLALAERKAAPQPARRADQARETSEAGTGSEGRVRRAASAKRGAPARSGSKTRAKQVGGGGSKRGRSGRRSS